MWIHLPTMPSACVPASAEWSLDYEQLSRDLERSVTSSGKSRPAKFWRRVLQTKPSLRLLSGLICPPSTLSRGVAEYISLKAARPASPSAAPDNSVEFLTKGTFSQRSSELRPDWDTQTSFWRTSAEAPSSDTTMTPYDPNYERWVTRLRRLSSQRQKSAHLTRGSGSSSWPTPDTQNFRDGSVARKEAKGAHAVSLHHKAAHWMTPNTMDALPPKSQEALDHEHETARPGRATPNNLRDQASVQAGMTFWPTPATRDHKGFDSPGKQNAHQDPAMYLSTLPDQPIETDGHTCSTKCLRLSPLFAEWLIGIPQNWTALEDYGVSATESYPLWRLSLGATLQRSCASLAH